VSAELHSLEHRRMTAERSAEDDLKVLVSEQVTDARTNLIGAMKAADRLEDDRLAHVSLAVSWWAGSTRFHERLQRRWGLES
jgi:hypothetical protein